MKDCSDKERKERRQIDGYNAQKQGDADLLDALAKLFFAFLPAWHN